MKTLQYKRIMLTLRTGLFVSFVLAGLFPKTALSQNGLPTGGSGDAAIVPVPYEEYSVRYIPNPLLKIGSERNHYVLLVDKSKQELYIYDGNLHKIKTYSCTTGSIPGNKRANGDRKTPEGIYFFTDVWEESELIRKYGKIEAKQFGIRAFDTNYPNDIDRLFHKNGYGIWLHATDKPERIRQPYDTKGCIVLHNGDMVEITPFIELNQTPVIIVKELEYVPEITIRRESHMVVEFIENWRTSWEQRDLNAYESAYAREFRNGDKNLKQWIEYKKEVLQRYIEFKIQVTDIRIFKTNEYYFAEFYQTFRTENYQDEGTKKLYLVDDNGAFKIISEQWHAAEQVNEMK